MIDRAPAKPALEQVERVAYVFRRSPFVTRTAEGLAGFLAGQGVLDLAGSYAGVVTFTGPGGIFVGDAGNHNLTGDEQGNRLDYSHATTGVQFNLATGYG